MDSLERSSALLVGTTTESLALLVEARGTDWLSGHGCTDEFSIVFPSQSSEAFDQDDEEEYTDDGSGEGAFGLVVPRGSEEARIDSVPVPEHRD